MRLVAYAVASSCSVAFAHTEEECLEKARGMIGTLLSSGWHTEDEMLAQQESDDPLYHWDYMSQDGFFCFFVTNGWTRAECETAFNTYLAWISTNDMSAVDVWERDFARSAIGQCEAMKYTKALGTIRAYARNPTAIDRGEVIDTAIRFGGVDESSAAFVETVVTNKEQFASCDVSWAVSAYCDKLLSVDTNDAVAVAIRNKAARLFYSNRLDWQHGSALDDLFSASLPGYAYSSNRLEYAQFVLSWTTNNDWRAMRNHFTVITNELLSSGVPLVELSIPLLD